MSLNLALRRRGLLTGRWPLVRSMLPMGVKFLLDQIFPDSYTLAMSPGAISS